MKNELNTMVMVQKYNSILKRMEGSSFSWAMAKKIVGGEKRLMRLMEEEKVHGFKPDGAPDSQWKINAVEVLANVKPMTGIVNLA